MDFTNNPQTITLKLRICIPKIHFLNLRNCSPLFSNICDGQIHYKKFKPFLTYQINASNEKLNFYDMKRVNVAISWF